MNQSKDKYNVSRFVPSELKELLTKAKPEIFQIGDYKIWCIYNPDVLFANSIVIEGNDGIIVVDTGVSKDAGKYIKSQLKKLTKKPVKTIIYTHHHYDHISGTDEIVSREQVEKKEIQIIAAENFLHEHTSENVIAGPIMAWRASYGYGMYLEPDDEKDYLIGGMMAKPCFGNTAYIKPNFFVEGSLDINLHGIKCHIFQTGGEATTEMAIYLPKFKVLLCADEIYPSNPNLHSLRGTKPRSVDNWINAIDKMRTLEIEHLVGNHGYPVSGKEKIQEILVKYRDIIQFQHDQTVRYINKGFTMDELVEKVSQLPEYLLYPPYSTNYYGHIKHNVPEFFVGYISWFSGDPVDLNPTPKVEKAKRFVELMGGEEKVFAEAERSFFDNKYQFAAELSTLLIRIDKNNHSARQLKAACLRKLGYQQVNSWWRAWYLTSALELEDKLDLKGIVEKRTKNIRSKEFVSALTIYQIYSRFRYTVDPSKAKDTHIIIGFEFTDTNEKFAFELRNSILEFRNEIPNEANATLIMKRTTLNNIIIGEDTIVKAILKRKIKITGNKKRLQEFFSYLDRDLEQINLTLR